MARIEKIDCCVVRVPMDRPTSFSTRTVEAREYGLVKARTTDGAEGIGYCYCGHKGGRLFAVAVQELLASVLLGQDANYTEMLWREMYAESLLHGRAGTVMRAISALDTALWDCNAQRARLPLHKYLGAAYERAIPAYASGGYYFRDKTPDDLAEEVRRYVDMGFRAVKIKVARESLAVEEKRIRKCREAIGPNILLMLDANNAWSDLQTALDFAKRVEQYDPYFLEEPFGPDDMNNHVRLAQATSIPIATGEILAGRWQFGELLAKNGAAIIQPDAGVCGGITEFRRIAAIAAGYGVQVFAHWLHHLHVHVLASCPNAGLVEFFPDDQIYNFGKIVDRQVQHEDGCLLLSEEPGLGFRFGEERIKQWSTVPWITISS